MGSGSSSKSFSRNTSNSWQIIFMKNKKKSFYFEDYTESEIYNIKNVGNVKVSHNRTTFLFFIFLSLVLIFSIKIIYLSLSSERFTIIKGNKSNLLVGRRNIVDRNGAVLATNVDLYDVGIRPMLLNIKQKKTLLIKLKILLPELDLNKIKYKLNNNNFFWLGKRLTPKEKDQLWLIGNKAFIFEPKPSRIYPQKNLFSHVLGQTDDINEGISGVEKFFDKDLRDVKKKINL